MNTVLRHLRLRPHPRPLYVTHVLLLLHAALVMPRWPQPSSEVPAVSSFLPSVSTLLLMTCLRTPRSNLSSPTQVEECLKAKRTPPKVGGERPGKEGRPVWPPVSAASYDRAGRTSLGAERAWQWLAVQFPAACGLRRFRCFSPPPPSGWSR